jgi:hypothetical protein
MHKVALDVKLFAIVVAKCKQSSILTSIQKKRNHYNYNYCQKATEAKADSGN